jgi:hypothetical protein
MAPVLPEVYPLLPKMNDDNGLSDKSDLHTDNGSVIEVGDTCLPTMPDRFTGDDTHNPAFMEKDIAYPTFATWSLFTRIKNSCWYHQRTYTTKQDHNRSVALVSNSPPYFRASKFVVA